MTTDVTPLLIGGLADVLATHAGQGVAAVGVGLLALLRLRRARRVGSAVTGAAVGIASSTATAIGVVVAFATVATAAGWWDPPIGQIVSDVFGAGGAVWDLVGETLVRGLIDALEAAVE